MAALVRAWEIGSESRHAFARRHGLTVARFDYWKRRVRQAAPAEAPVSFVPVQVVSDAPRPVAGAIEVVLVSGERLTLPAGVSSDQVRVVLAALRAPC
jgi:hypothetical protein